MPQLVPQRASGQQAWHNPATGGALAVFGQCTWSLSQNLDVTDPFTWGSKAALHRGPCQYANVKRRFDLLVIQEPSDAQTTSKLCASSRIRHPNDGCLIPPRTNSKWATAMYGAIRFQSKSRPSSFCIRMANDLQNRICELHTCHA